MVRNQSSRGGAKPRLIVLHSTEGHNRPGLEDLRGLGSWFDNPNAQASSHVANDAEGNDARYVPDERKAWTQAAYNPVALSIEQIGFARQAQWPDAQIRNTAAWIAHWAAEYGIPIRESTRHGVCSHASLGAKGGGHHDPGASYPLGRVLELARAIDGDDRKAAAWRRSLRIQRARLKSVLAGRARLRQEAYERLVSDDDLEAYLKASGRYRWTTRAMRATKSRITKLTRLIDREG